MLHEGQEVSYRGFVVKVESTHMVLSMSGTLDTLYKLSNGSEIIIVGPRYQEVKRPDAVST